MRTMLSAAAIAAALLMTSSTSEARRDFYGPWITLYSAPYFQGAAVTLRDSEPNLSNYSFNDRAQSVRARGPWMLCRGRYFQEGCVAVSGDIPSLKPYDMNRRAGSVMLRR